MASTPQGVGSDNRMAVMREIVLNGPLSRKEIAGRLDLSEAALSRIARRVIDEGLVRELEERPDPDAGPGRPAVPLDVEPRGGYVLGIGIDPMLQTVTLTDLKNQVIAGTDLNLPAIDEPDAAIAQLADEGLRLIDQHLAASDRARLLGGFTMITGAVDTVAGTVRYSPYLREWRDVPLRSQLADRLGIPMSIAGLANTIAMAEVLFGAARGRQHVLCTTCGIGLGTGLILNGRLVTGHRDNAGVVGLMEVTDQTGARTTLDQVASGFGLLQRLKGHDVELSGATMAGLAQDLWDAIERDREGDLTVAAAMSELGWRLGFITVQAIRFVAPEIFVIAGPLATAPSYVAAATAALTELLGPIDLEVVASSITGPVSGGSATCGLAICEYLFSGGGGGGRDTHRSGR